MLARRYDVLEELSWQDAPGEGIVVDLIVVDGLSLHRHWERLVAERRAHEPVQLPILLLTDRKDAGLTTRAVWQVVDDVLLRPVERLELAARVESLLRARRLSLRLRRMSVLYEAERRITERLQEAALPKALPQIPGLALDAYYHAGQDEARIGGDWYDALRLPDGRVIVTVGDVSGSGLDAAVTMGSVRQVLRGVAQIHPDPAMMLDAADRTLQADDPDRIVTAFVAVLDPVTSELTYASAGHPRPLLRRGDADWTELTASGMPLGVPAKGGRVAETVVMPGDAMLVLYTDGLTEATHDIAASAARSSAISVRNAATSLARAPERANEATCISKRLRAVSRSARWRRTSSTTSSCRRYAASTEAAGSSRRAMELRASPATRRTIRRQRLTSGPRARSRLRRCARAKRRRPPGARGARAGCAPDRARSRPGPSPCRASPSRLARR